MANSPSKLMTRAWRRVTSTSSTINKQLYQMSKYQPGERKALLFILGFQRSGTTLMLRIFERDLNTKIYGEFSILSSLDKERHIRLNPLPMVKEVIDKDRAPLIIVKPLVETQNATKLFDYFKEAKGLWMYRHYKDVISSAISRFGARRGDALRCIVDRIPNNWRSENVPDAMREIVLKHFSEEMNPYDAAALFWFVRNNFFFHLNLDKNPAVMICKYEDLVISPLTIMRQVYDFVGCPFPGEKAVTEVHASSVKKGANIELSPEIELLCQEMWDKLNKVYQAAEVR
jgi:hypothetical protein